MCFRRTRRRARDVEEQGTHAEEYTNVVATEHCTRLEYASEVAAEHVLCCCCDRGWC
jgi:hypothetical protein